MAEAVEKPLAEISTNSPANVRAGDKSSPKPPVRQNTVGLEEQMAELLAGTSALSKDCKDANKDCLRVKRRSRDWSICWPSAKRWTAAKHGIVVSPPSSSSSCAAEHGGRETNVVSTHKRGRLHNSKRTSVGSGA